MADATSSVSDQNRVIVRECGEGTVTVHLPHTSYDVRLHCADPSAFTPGQRATITVHADALQMSPCTGGGRFIEPVSGEPRIVAGMVKAIDRDQNRVLIDVSMKIWITVSGEQSWEVFEEGGLVNGYIRESTAVVAV